MEDPLLEKEKTPKGTRRSSREPRVSRAIPFHVHSSTKFRKSLARKNLWIKQIRRDCLCRIRFAGDANPHAFAHDSMINGPDIGWRGYGGLLLLTVRVGGETIDGILLELAVLLAHLGSLALCALT